MSGDPLERYEQINAFLSDLFTFPRDPPTTDPAPPAEPSPSPIAAALSSLPSPALPPLDPRTRALDYAHMREAVDASLTALHTHVEVAEAIDRFQSSPGAPPNAAAQLTAALPSLPPIAPGVGGTGGEGEEAPPPLLPRATPPGRDGVYYQNLIKRGFTPGDATQYVAYYAHVQAMEAVEGWHTAMKEVDGKEDERRKRKREEGLQPTATWTWEEFQQRRRPNVSLIQL